MKRTDRKWVAALITNKMLFVYVQIVCMHRTVRVRFVCVHMCVSDKSLKSDLGVDICVRLGVLKLPQITLPPTTSAGLIEGNLHLADGQF